MTLRAMIPTPERLAWKDWLTEVIKGNLTPEVLGQWRVWIDELGEKNPHNRLVIMCDALLTALREAEQACGDYFKPPNDLAGAIKNIRQVALSEQGNVDTLQQRVEGLETLLRDDLYLILVHQETPGAPDRPCAKCRIKAALRGSEMQEECNCDPSRVMDYPCPEHGVPHISFPCPSGLNAHDVGCLGRGGGTG